MTYAQCKARGDTRGMNYAGRKALIQKTLQLSVEVKGPRSVFTKRLKAMLVSK